MLRLGIAEEAESLDAETRARLAVVADEVQGVIDEVRAVSQGLYPPVLRDAGLVAALRDVRRRTPVPLTVDADGIGRYSPEVESAVYYSCLEAIQNAIKHGGLDVHVSVTLREDRDDFRFDVAD